jgi:cytochrome c peroxidase
MKNSYGRAVEVTHAELRPLRAAAAAVALMSLVSGRASSDDFKDNQQAFPDPTGMIATVNVNGRTDTSGAFFQSLGINGRSCATCHVANQAMSISTPQIRERYDRTNGADPLFAPVDGANCANVRRTDREGHSLLLHHGLIRIALVLPSSPQFQISVVHDPYGCALVTDPSTTLQTVSVYRRPLPTANLNFLSTIMFDGRETKLPLTSEASFPANLQFDLADQASKAATTHFQAQSAPTTQQLDDIVDFELGLYTAQARDNAAGRLDAHGALGGPSNLAAQQRLYYPGVNDVLGADPMGMAFNPTSMTEFAAWADSRDDFEDYERAAARREIAAGEQIFDTMPLTITNVRGLNDNAALNHPSSFQGTCTSCHDAPNVGDHSLPLPLDIGVGHTGDPRFETDPSIVAALSELNEPDLPVFRIEGCSSPFNVGEPASFYTTDPGKALITGLCSDLNRVKGPILRGLAARAPYFHNGAAASLLDVVNFYNKRFQMNLSQKQKEQLVVFLNSL